MLARRGTCASRLVRRHIQRAGGNVQRELSAPTERGRRYASHHHPFAASYDGATAVPPLALFPILPESACEDPVPLPHPHAKGNVDAWVAVLEPFIPTPGSDLSVSFLQKASYLIPRILLEARRQANIDILFHIGVTCKRWATFMWIAHVLVDKPRPYGFFGVDLKSLESGQWPRDVLLDSGTAEDASSHKKAIPLAASFRLRRERNTADDLMLLDEFTDSGLPHRKGGPMAHLRDILGQVWQTIGRMILEASHDRAKGEADVVMQKALSILARLHHRGYIPDQVYACTPGTDDRLSQPPLLHDLSMQIFSSLSDAAYDNDLSAWQDFPDGAGNLQQQYENCPSLWKNFQMIRFTPGLWLELVLWCCVHGGWLKEGASILAETKNSAGDQTWSLICWKNIVTSPESKWSEIVERRFAIHQNPNDFVESRPELQGSRTTERTITAEVVVAHIDGLVSATSGANPGYKLQEVLEKIFVLKSFLEKDKMSLGISTWEALIARLSELPELSIDSYPRVLESILTLTDTYGRASSSANAPQANHHQSLPAPYFLEGTAVTLSLYHRVLMSYIHSGDLEGALRLVARLQALTDTNKRKALGDFFKLLKSNKSSMTWGTRRKSPSAAAQSSTPIEYPAFYPNIPVDVLAALLDLLTDSGSMEVGRWMIYSEDVDGPLITKDHYSDQVLAPSLIRFAAASQDEPLLVSLSKAQSTSISGGTLLALCEARIVREKWQDATNVLRLMSEYSLHEWTIQDFTIIIRALLRHLKTPAKSPSYQSSAAILQRLLRGDLGQAWGPDFAQLDTTVGVICSLNPDLAKLCSNLLSHGHVLRTSMPTQAFNLIMQGVVSTFGSTAGKDLWQLWCEPLGEVRKISIPCPNHEGGTHKSVSRQFSRQEQQPEVLQKDIKLVSFVGSIEPGVRTLRYIVEQAFAESRSSSHTENIASDLKDTNRPSCTVHETPREVTEILHWAAHIFRTRFSLRPVDIKHELGGFLPISQAQILSPTTLYRGITFQVWDALSSTPSCKSWALATEQTLRSFAADSLALQKIFDAAPSAERKFLHCLAADLGMNSESFGEESIRQVTVSKTTMPPVVPSLTVQDVAHMKPHEIRRLFLPPNG